MAIFRKKTVFTAGAMVLVLFIGMGLIALRKYGADEKQGTTQGPILSTTGAFWGKLIDQNGNPMGNVDVAIGPLLTKSDSFGNFSIFDIPFGTYQPMFFKEGKPLATESNENSIFINPGAVEKTEIVLASLSSSPSPSQEPYASSVKVVSSDQSVVLGQPIHIKAEATNNGSLTWNKESTENKYFVLRGHAYLPDGKWEQDPDVTGAHLPSDIASGKSATFNLEIPTGPGTKINQLGETTMGLEMVHEGVKWFGEEAKVKVMVKSFQVRWSFDESSGNVINEVTNQLDKTHNGTAVNANIISGKSGGARYFNGQNGSTDGYPSYVKASLSNDLSSNYTVSAWLKLQNGGTWNSQRGGLITPNGCGGGVELSIQPKYVDDTRASQYLMLGRCGYYNGELSSSVIPFLEWTHIAVTVDANKKVTYYVNGKESGSWSAADKDTTLSKDIRIGGYKNRYLNGTVDEVRVYGSALSAEEVGKLYKGE